MTTTSRTQTELKSASDLSRDHEKVLLGGLLNNPALIPLVKDRLEPSHFADAWNASVYRHLCRLPIPSMELLGEELKGEPHPPGSNGWITYLLDAEEAAGSGPMSPARAVALRDAILDLALKRRKRRTILDFAIGAQNGRDPDELFAELRQVMESHEEETARVAMGETLAKSTRTYQEILDDESDPPEAVLGDGLLRPRQIGNIHGLDGSCKSFGALHLLVAAATGIPCFGISTRPGGIRCGYVSLEDDIWEIRKRLKAVAEAMHADKDLLNANLYVVCPPYFDSDFDLVDPKHAVALRDWIAANQLKLVAVDHLARAHNLPNEFDMRPVAKAGISIARATTSALVFLGHDRKPPAGGNRGSDQASYRGDSRFSADCRFKVGMKRAGKNRIRFTVEKSTGQAEPEPIWLEQIEGGGRSSSRMPRRDPPKPPRSADARWLSYSEKRGSRG